MGRRHEPQEALGRAVQQLRSERGLTQVQLARAADTDGTAISHLERGRTNPAWGTMRRIAAALGVTVSDLAARSEQIERDDAAGKVVTPTGRAAGPRARRGRSSPRP
jgi:transcriptional regulator with XRE-family HTH domain